MKSIMLSVQPKWVAKILNKDKTIEVRKQFPKNYIGWVYIYCTKGNGKERLYPVALLDKSNQVFKRAYREDHIDNRTNYLNGKVVARFWCDKVSEIRRFMESDHGEFAFAYWDTKPFPNIENIETKACLTTSELDNYARTKGKIDSVKLNAIHITKLEIFDEPKELGEFCTIRVIKCKNCKYHKIECSGISANKCNTRKPLTKAPQNYCYVEE